MATVTALAVAACSEEPKDGWHVVSTEGEVVNLAQLPVIQTGETVRLWEAAKYLRVKRGDPTGHKILREFDCSQKRYRWLEVILTPETLNSEDTDFSKEWEFTVPDSLDAELQAIACDGKELEGKAYDTAEQAFSALTTPTSPPSK